MKIRFQKMNGAGNDFVCIDNLKGHIKLTKKQIAKLCNRQQGAGADGLLLLEQDLRNKADFRMRYFNADGGEAEMCGNGARCFARFARQVAKWRKQYMIFRTKAGLIQAVFIGEDVRITLTSPQDIRLHIPLPLRQGNVEAHALNTGVPHVVLFGQDIIKAKVKEMGVEIRYHEFFAPKGTNVNFVQLLKPGHIRIRTYERGVEDETLACGTGMVASAIASFLVHGFDPPIKVHVQGGDILEVDFTIARDDKTDTFVFNEVTLEGPATFTYQGEIYV